MPPFVFFALLFVVAVLHPSADPRVDLVLDLEGYPLNQSPYFNDDYGVMEAVRSRRGDELERKYGPRPWLALPTDNLLRPPDRDDISKTA